MAKIQIFTAKDYVSLKQIQRQMHDLTPLLDKGEGCGVMCDEMRAAVAEILRITQQLEADFMAPPPTK